MNSMRPAIGVAGFYDLEGKKWAQIACIDIVFLLISPTSLKALIGHQITSGIEVVASERGVKWLYCQIAVLSLLRLAIWRAPILQRDRKSVVEV